MVRMVIFYCIRFLIVEFPKSAADAKFCQALPAFAVSATHLECPRSMP